MTKTMKMKALSLDEQVKGITGPTRLVREVVRVNKYLILLSALRCKHIYVVIFHTYNTLIGVLVSVINTLWG